MKRLGPLPLAGMPLAHLLILVAVACPLATARGQASATGPTAGIGIDQKLGAKVPLDVTFRDETGRLVRLDDYFGRRPVLLSLVYYECPMLCTQELNGLTRSLRVLSLDPGRDFEIVTVSISPSETPSLASAKKAGYLRRYERPGAERGWHFLTGDEAAIHRLAQSVGFRYTYNSRTKLYAHAAGLIVLTPDGRTSRYFYGIDFPARDLRLSLIEASAGTIGTPTDRMLMFCYQFDPATGRYSLAVLRLLNVLAAGTALSLGSYLLVMVRRERRRGVATLADVDPPLRPSTP